MSYGQPLFSKQVSQTCPLKELLFRKNSWRKVVFLSKVARKKRTALLKMTTFMKPIKKVIFSKAARFVYYCC